MNHRTVVLVAVLLVLVELLVSRWPHGPDFPPACADHVLSYPQPADAGLWGAEGKPTLGCEGPARAGSHGLVTSLPSSDLCPPALTPFIT